MAVLMAGIGVGLAVHRRDVLRTPGPWLALALAALLAAPNVAWDAAHGWPNLTMDRVLSREQGGPLGSLVTFPELPLLLAGPPLIGLWWLGLRWLRSPEVRSERWLVPAGAVVAAVFALGGGKVYYAAPLLMPLFAAGAFAAPMGWYPRRALPSAVDGAGEFIEVTEVAPITLPAGLKNAETERHAAIYLCRRPRGSWAQLWPELRHVD